MSTQQNLNGVPAVVMGFHTEEMDGETREYPEALPTNAAAATTAAVPPPTPFEVPSKPEKKVDGSESSGPAPRNTPVGPAGPRDFSSGICDFYQSWLICADAYCCTYCLASAQHNMLMNEQEGIFWPLCCGMFCVDVGLQLISPYLPSSVCFHTCFMRHALRQRYHLHSSAPVEGGSGEVECNTEFMTDFLTVCFCLSCAIAQHQREIILQGDWCGGVLSDRKSLEMPGEVHTV